jgi:hypothetical protein
MFDRYAKAIVGALVAAAGTWGTAIADGSITATEWSAIVVTALLSLGVIWGVPNTSTGTSADVTEYTTVSTSHPVESIQMTTKTDPALSQTGNMPSGTSTSSITRTNPGGPVR